MQTNLSHVFILHAMLSFCAENKSTKSKRSSNKIWISNYRDITLMRHPCTGMLVLIYREIICCKDMGGRNLYWHSWITTEGGFNNWLDGIIVCACPLIVKFILSFLPIFPKTSNFRQSFPKPSTFRQYFPNLMSYCEYIVLLKTFKLLPIFPKTFKLLPIFPKTFKLLPIFPKTFKLSPVFPKTFKLSPVFPKTFIPLPILLTTFQHSSLYIILTGRSQRLNSFTRSVECYGLLTERQYKLYNNRLFPTICQLLPDLHTLIDETENDITACDFNTFLTAYAFNALNSNL